MFFSEYSTTDGSFVCKGSIGGTSIDYAAAVVGDGSGGSFYIIGWFRGTNVNFDHVYGSTLLTSGVSGTSSDIFFGSYLLKPGGPGCIIGLPVELINYNSGLKKNIVEITWQTASELNNNFFSLERSYDGINYEYITKIVGAGNSNSMLYYGYEDNTVNFNYATSYYKLTQYDYDGKSNSYFTSCDISDVLDNNLDNVRFNSKSNNLEIFVKSNIDSELKIYISDIRGLFLNQEIVKVVKGSNRIEFNFDFLNSGIYLATIYLNCNIKMWKFIKCY